MKKRGKPYVKSLGYSGKFKVFLVDGEYVRDNFCEDFINEGQQLHFNFIPKKEFWISKEKFPGEEVYFIDHLKVEHRLMKEGMPYCKAYRHALLIQRRERAKSKIIAGLKKLGKNNPEVIHKIHKKLIEKHNNSIKVFLVNGEIVRDLFDPDFGGGGHDKVYPYVPKNEIWLDDDFSLKERRFILVHELRERRLMKHKNWNYKKAHKQATELEDFCRHHPKKLEKAIALELKRQ